MALYAAVLGPLVPDAIGHILSASILSAPAAILVAAVMVPPRGCSKRSGRGEGACSTLITGIN